MFENARRGRQARNFTTNVPKILDLTSSSEQIFSKNWRWVPLINDFQKQEKRLKIAILKREQEDFARTTGDQEAWLLVDSNWKYNVNGS